MKPDVVQGQALRAKRFHDVGSSIVFYGLQYSYGLLYVNPSGPRRDTRPMDVFTPDFVQIPGSLLKRVTHKGRPDFKLPGHPGNLSPKLLALLP